MEERYIKWWTPYLSREFEVLVFGSGRGWPLTIFPTSFGRYHQNKDFGPVDSVARFVDNDSITVYCPDSLDLDSFYNKGIHPADRIRTQIAHENVIVRDVFIGTGEWDSTRQESMRLSGILNSKEIGHWLDDRKWCGHDWNYWRDMLPYYLSTL